ncbi:alpha/beta hydrolase [Nocardia sp. NPDC049190]|uniref:alpha/beta hydrolase n=1 Tax=Nocardia sp. NPDC049190 TaxID=3155650 RepID=UPI0033EC3795
MSIMIPPWLEWLGWVAGSEWPDGDEDEQRAGGEDLQRHATQLRTRVRTSVESAIGSTLLAYPAGSGRDEMEKSLKEQLKLIDELAEYYDEGGRRAIDSAGEMRATKLNAIFSLAWLAAELAYAAFLGPGAPFAQAGAIGATQFTCKWLGAFLLRRIEAILQRTALSDARQYFVKKVVYEFFQEGITEVIESSMQEGAVQGLQLRAGYQKGGLNWAALGENAFSSGVAGGVGGTAGHGIHNLVDRLPSGHDQWSGIAKGALTGGGAGAAGAIAAYAVGGGGEFDPRMLTGGALSGVGPSMIYGWRGGSNYSGGPMGNGPGLSPDVGTMLDGTTPSRRQDVGTGNGAGAKTGSGNGSATRGAGTRTPGTNGSDTGARAPGGQRTSGAAAGNASGGVDSPKTVVAQPSTGSHGKAVDATATSIHGGESAVGAAAEQPAPADSDVDAGNRSATFPRQSAAGTIQSAGTGQHVGKVDAGTSGSTINAATLPAPSHPSAAHHDSADIAPVSGTTAGTSAGSDAAAGAGAVPGAGDTSGVVATPHPGPPSAAPSSFSTAPGATPSSSSAGSAPGSARAPGAATTSSGRTSVPQSESHVGPTAVDRPAAAVPERRAGVEAPEDGTTTPDPRPRSGLTGPSAAGASPTGAAQAQAAQAKAVRADAVQAGTADSEASRARTDAADRDDGGRPGVRRPGDTGTAPEVEHSRAATDTAVDGRPHPNATDADTKAVVQQTDSKYGSSAEPATVSNAGDGGGHGPNDPGDDRPAAADPDEPGSREGDSADADIHPPHLGPALPVDPGFTEEQQRLADAALRDGGFATEDRLQRRIIRGFAVSARKRATVNADWWHALADPAHPDQLSQVQQALVRVYPHQIGNADGLPAPVRNDANRLAITRDIEDFIARRPSGRGRWWWRYVLSEAERRHFSNLVVTRNHLVQLDRQAAALPGEPPVHVLAYDAAAFGGSGKVMVALGNVDTAQTVNWHVPGTNTTLRSLLYQFTPLRNLYEETKRVDPNLELASVIWIGYAAPTGPVNTGYLKAAFRRRAKVGGDLLLHEIAAFHATRERAGTAGPDRLKSRIFAHSYAVVTVSYAGKRGRLAGLISSVWMSGAPGSPADSAAEFGIGDNVHVVSSWRDGVTMLGADQPGAWSRYGSGRLGHGLDPASEAFGARRSRAEYPLSDNFGKVEQVHQGYLRHSDPHTRRPTESLADAARIAAGRGDTVTPVERRRPAPDPGWARRRVGAAPIDVERGRYDDGSSDTRADDGARPKWAAVSPRRVAHVPETGPRDCAVRSMESVQQLTGSTAIDVAAAQEIGLGGMRWQDLETHAGGRLQAESHATIANRLRRMGHGATTLVVDEYHGVAERNNGVGAHAYVMTNHNGIIVVRDPATNEVRRRQDWTPPAGVVGTWGIHYNAAGVPQHPSGSVVPADGNSVRPIDGYAPDAHTRPDVRLGVRAASSPLDAAGETGPANSDDGSRPASSIGASPHEPGDPDRHDAPIEDEWTLLRPEQVGARLAERTGSAVFGFDLPGLDPESVREYARAVIDMRTAYPDVYVRSIGVGPLPDSVDGRSYAHIDPTNGRLYTDRIVISDRLPADPGAFQHRLQRRVDTGEALPSVLDRPIYSLFVHEFGYAVDHAGSLSAQHAIDDVLLEHYWSTHDPATVEGYQDWLGGLSNGSFDEDGVLEPREALAAAFRDVVLDRENASEPATVIYDLLTSVVEPLPGGAPKSPGTIGDETGSDVPGRKRTPALPTDELLATADDRVAARTAYDGWNAETSSPGGPRPGWDRHGDVVRQAREQARETARWWHSLSSTQQESVVRVDPARIGRSDGIPARVRNRANRLAIRRRLTELGIGRSLFFARLQLIGDNPARSETHERKNLVAIWKALRKADRLAESVRPGRAAPPVHLLFYQAGQLSVPSDGTAVVAIGDVDIEAEVSWHLPGAQTDLMSLGGLLTAARNQLAATVHIDPDVSAAAVAWLGDVMPHADPHRDRISAVWGQLSGLLLARDIGAFTGTREFGAGLPDGVPAPANHLFGSEHGAKIVGDAGAGSRLKSYVATITVAGSLGMGSVRRATDFGVGADNVFVAAASWDQTSWLGERPPEITGPGFGDFEHRISWEFGAGLGVDPATAPFGAHRIRAEHPRPLLPSRRRRTNYYRPGSESLHTFGMIGAGRGAEVPFEPPRPGLDLRSLPARPGATGDDPAARRPATTDTGVRAHRPPPADPVLRTRAAGVHDNRCAPKALHRINQLFGRLVVGVPAGDVGLSGMPADELERHAGGRLQSFESHDDLADRLRLMGKGATVLVVDEFHGPVDAHGVGAHAYVMTNNGSTIMVYDPRGGIRPYRSGTQSPDVRRTYGIVIDSDGIPELPIHIHDPVAHPGSRIGATEKNATEKNTGPLRAELGVRAEGPDPGDERARRRAGLRTWDWLSENLPGWPADKVEDAGLELAELVADELGVVDGEVRVVLEVTGTPGERLLRVTVGDSGFEFGEASELPRWLADALARVPYVRLNVDGELAIAVSDRHITELATALAPLLVPRSPEKTARDIIRGGLRRIARINKARLLESQTNVDGEPREYRLDDSEAELTIYAFSKQEFEFGLHRLDLAGSDDRTLTLDEFTAAVLGGLDQHWLDRVGAPTDSGPAALETDPVSGLPRHVVLPVRTGQDVAQSRWLIRRVMSGWPHPADVGSAVSLVSDLAGNLLVHPEATGSVTTTVSGEPGNRVVRVAVREDNMRAGWVADVEARLSLRWLARLAAASGVDPHSEGRTFWFEFRETVPEGDEPTADSDRHGVDIGDDDSAGPPLSRGGPASVGAEIHEVGQAAVGMAVPPADARPPAGYELGAAELAALEEVVDVAPLNDLGDVFRVEFGDGSVWVYRTEMDPEEAEDIGVPRSGLLVREVAMSALDQVFGAGLVPESRFWRGPYGLGTLTTFVPHEPGLPVRGYSKAHRHWAAVLDYIGGNIDRNPSNWGTLPTAGETGTQRVLLFDNTSTLPEDPNSFMFADEDERGALVGRIRSPFVLDAFDERLDATVLARVRAFESGRLRTLLQTLGVEPEAIDDAVRRLEEIQRNGKITGAAFPGLGSLNWVVGVGESIAPGESMTAWERAVYDHDRASAVMEGRLGDSDQRDGLFRVRFPDDDSLWVYRPETGRWTEEISVPPSGLAVRDVAFSRLDALLGFGSVPVTTLWGGPDGNGSLMEFVARGPTRAVAEYSPVERGMLAALDYIAGSHDRSERSWFSRESEPGRGRLVPINNGFSFPVDHESFAPHRTSPPADPEIRNQFTSRFVAYAMTEGLESSVLAKIRAMDPARLEAMLAALGLEGPAIDGALARLKEIRVEGRITGAAWLDMTRSNLSAGVLMPMDAQRAARSSFDD